MNGSNCAIEFIFLYFSKFLSFLHTHFLSRYNQLFHYLILLFVMIDAKSLHSIRIQCLLDCCVIKLKKPGIAQGRNYTISKFRRAPLCPSRYNYKYADLWNALAVFYGKETFLDDKTVWSSKLKGIQIKSHFTHFYLQGSAHFEVNNQK